MTCSYLAIWLLLLSFFINNTNNKHCLLAVHWTSIGSGHLGVGLLLVHWKSIGKVRWTLWSDQKCPDKHQKIIGKILWWKSKKICILLTLSPTESAQKSSGSVKTSFHHRLMYHWDNCHEYQTWKIIATTWWKDEDKSEALFCGKRCITSSQVPLLQSQVYSMSWC